MNRSSFSLALLVAALLTARESQATIMVPLSIEDMAVRATVVLRGRVLTTRAAWDEKKERIFTYTEIEVRDRIHAPSGLPEKITVRTLGGEVGEIGMRVSGTERFTLNEDVVIFLRKDPVEASTFQTIGMSQGKFQIVEESKGTVVAIPSVEGLAFARPDDSGTLKVDAHEATASRIPLVALRQRVLAAIAKQVPASTAPAISTPVIKDRTTPPASSTTR